MRLVAYTVLGAVACHGSPSSAPDMDLAGSFDVPCATWSNALCARSQACAPDLLSRQWGSLTTCVERHTLLCLAGASAPGSGYTPDLLTTCSSAFATQPCGERIFGDVPAACATTGSRSDGQACSFDEQCLSGFCHVVKYQACGTCEEQTTPGTSPCNLAGDCSGAQLCTMERCQVAGMAGATCSDALPCEEELGCVLGVCQPRGATAGVACDPKEVTLPRCAQALSLYCGADGTCQPTTLVAPGDACDGVDLCDGTSTCSNGLCVPRSLDNQPCDPAINDACLTPARCIIAGGNTGTCRLPDPESCQ